MRLPLAQGRFLKAHVPTQVMGIKVRRQVLQAMAGEGGNLGFVASGQRKAGHCGSSQIVEGQASHLRLRQNLAPRRAEAVRGPRRAGHGRKDGHGLLVLCGFVQCGLQDTPNGKEDSLAGLPLLQADVQAVIGGPRQIDMDQAPALY